MANLVGKQGEGVEVVTEHVSDASVQVEQAHHELIQAEVSAMKQRRFRLIWLVVSILGMLGLMSWFKLVSWLL